MSSPLRVDYAALDRTQFKVVEEGGEILVIPLKDKFRWDDHELHLRSLVLDANGHVVSAGLPKFFNIGEHPDHDREFAEAMARGVVEFPEKLDGSLIVADRAAGVARMRTRGRRVLGEFGPEVEPLVAQRYPRLMEFLRDDPLLDRHSLVFEFVSPVRSVVLRYDEARLYLLGYVAKNSVTPHWDAATLGRIARDTGVETAPVHALAADLDGALAQVRSWKGREGVVARFHNVHGVPRLMKIKAADYLRLHAYRSRLGGRGALKVAWLLDLRDDAQLLPALARYGLDWEAAEFARAEVSPYITRRREAFARFDAFREIVAPWMGVRDRGDKRTFVERVRTFMAADQVFADRHWFTVAMKLFDAADDGEALLVLDAAVLGEAPTTLRLWRNDADAEIRAILTAPVRDDT